MKRKTYTRPRAGRLVTIAALVSLITVQLQIAAAAETQMAPLPPTGNQPSVPADGFPADIPANAPLRGGRTVGSAAVEGDDQSFLDTVAKSTAAEVIASTVELQRTQDSKMEDFAKQLLADSSEISQTLKPLAARKRISLPAAMSDDDRGKIKAMHQLDSPAMDREYVRLYGADTQMAMLDLFDRTARQAKDNDIKAFAANNLPKLKRDAEAARTLSVTDASAADGSRRQRSTP